MLFFIKETELENLADGNTLYVSNKDLRKLVLETLQNVLKVNGTEITSASSVSLFDIKIDDKLHFDKHVSNFCKIESRQLLNAICSLQCYMN